MIRTFVAVGIEPAVTERIVALQVSIKEANVLGVATVRWMPAASMHFTLQFLGSTDPARVEEIVAALGALRERPSFELRLGGLGVFPDGRRPPHTMWLGLREGADTLVSLAREVNRDLEPLGFEVEKREYLPHLTIARIKNAQRFDAGTLERFLSDVGPTRVSAVTLYRSNLHPDGAKYVSLGAVQLADK